MLNEATLEQIKSLKLAGMAQALEQQLASPQSQTLSFEERLGLLIEAEVNDRTYKREIRLKSQAKLKHSGAYIESINYRTGRGLDKAKISSLALCQWVDDHQNLIITGPTGVGKTWLSCAFGMEVIRRGMPVIYMRVGRLLEEVAIARADGSLPKLRVKVAKCRLLILDDWGLSPLTDIGRQDLLEFIDDRLESGSVIIASQLPIKAWYDYINEPTLADAILDRIVHRAHKIEMHGESMRKKMAISKGDKA